MAGYPVPQRSSGALPDDAVGVGLKPAHANDVLRGGHGLAFFEVHAENYMGAGGPPHHLLAAVRQHYPLSLHGVGLSIGGAAQLDGRHLQRLRRLVERYEPALFSEHLAWSSHGSLFFNDLLPLPYNRESLARVCEHVDRVQDMLRMPMLLENPATYVTFEHSTLSESEFLRIVAARTGCLLLLDVNNVYVSAINHKFEPMAYIDSFPLEHVREIHLAGFSDDRDDNGARFLIDSHATPVAETVWALYRRTLARTGPVPTLIEWDNDVPGFDGLIAEGDRARELLAAETERRHRWQLAA